MLVHLLTSHDALYNMEHFAALAALTCHANTDREFVPSEVLTPIIKLGHESILEHINLTYCVKGLSRACLQELARHRHISLSVESTRHTLRKQFKQGNHIQIPGFVPQTKTDEYFTHFIIVNLLANLSHEYPDMSNDELKYFLPEFWPTNLILTSNVRELRHILKLRTAPAALNEFRVLAYSLFEAVPDKFRYLLADCVYKEEKS